MDMNSKKENKKGVIYDMYGILNDYLIDTNQYMAMNGSYYNYDNFQTWNKWEVAKIDVEGKSFLIVDIDLNRFSYCRYIGFEKKVLKSGLNSKDAIVELQAYSKLLGIDVLDQMEFYLRGRIKTIQPEVRNTKSKTITVAVGEISRDS